MKDSFRRKMMEINKVEYCRCDKPTGKHKAKTRRITRSRLKQETRKLVSEKYF